MVSATGNQPPLRGVSSLREHQLLETHLEQLLDTNYFSTQLVQLASPILTKKTDVAQLITRRIMHINSGLLLNKYNFENIRALAHTVVRTALQIAYPGSRCDIFTISLNDNISSFSNTIAGAVLIEIFPYTDSLLYASVISSFIAYGVDFTQLTHQLITGGNVVNENIVNVPLSSLDSALRCLHAVGEKLILHLADALLTVTNIYENLHSDNETGEKELKRLNRLLLNNHILVSLLKFFSKETSGEVEIETMRNMEEENNTNTFLPTFVIERSFCYTTAHFYRLFEPDIKTDISNKTNDIELKNIGYLFGMIFARVISYLRTFDVKWNFDIEENVKHAHNVLCSFSTVGKMTFTLIAQYCRDFPPIFQAVKKVVKDTFCLEKLIFSQVLLLPHKTIEELNKKCSVFYNRRIFNTQFAVVNSVITFNTTTHKQTELMSTKMITMKAKTTTTTIKDDDNCDGNNTCGDTKISDFTMSINNNLQNDSMCNRPLKYEVLSQNYCNAYDVNSTGNKIKNYNLNNSNNNQSTGNNNSFSTSYDLVWNKSTENFFSNDVGSLRGKLVTNNIPIKNDSYMTLLSTQTLTLTSAPKVTRKNPCSEYVGLKNVGNTCFINSFTQLFFVAKYFRMDLVNGTFFQSKMRSFLFGEKYEVSDNDNNNDNNTSKLSNDYNNINDEKVSFGFALLLAFMHWNVSSSDSYEISVDPTFFTSLLPSPFNDGFQHDASEYGKMLLEVLDRTETRLTKEIKQRKVIVDVNNEEENKVTNTASKINGVNNNNNNNNNEEKENSIYHYTNEDEGGCEKEWEKTKDVDYQTDDSNNVIKKNNIDSNVNNEHLTLVAKWFGGILASTVECMGCHHIRTQQSPFWDISIPLCLEEEEEEVTMVANNSNTSNENLTDDDDDDDDNDDNNNNNNNRLEDKKEVRREHVVKSEDGYAACTTYNNSNKRNKRNKNKKSDSYCVKENVRDKYFGLKNVVKRSKPSLQELVNNVINYHGRGELLCGENATYCESCCKYESVMLRTAVHTTCSRLGLSAWGKKKGANESQKKEEKTFSERDIEGAPFYLTLQLNRFRYIWDQRNYEKVMDEIVINEHLTLPVRVTMCSGRSGSNSGDDENKNEDNKEVVDKLVNYRLIAVLVHSGSSPRSGHYFTLLRCPQFSSQQVAANEENEEEEEENEQKNSKRKLNKMRNCGAKKNSDVDSERGVNNNFRAGEGIYDEGEEEEETQSVWVLANDARISPLSTEVVKGVLSGTGGVFSHLETPYIILYERCSYPSFFPFCFTDVVFTPEVEELFRSVSDRLRCSSMRYTSLNNENDKGDNGDNDYGDGAILPSSGGVFGGGGGRPIY